MSRLNNSFDSYAQRRPQNKAKNFMNNTSFFARSDMGMNDSTISRRQGSPNKHFNFPPTMTLAEFNKVKYGESIKKPSIPDLNTPQRIKLPPYFNTPSRILPANKEEKSISPTKAYNQEESFLDISMISDKKNATFIGNRSVSPIKKYDKKITLDVKVASMRRIKDYELLSQACKRAGKTREEGRAYYSMGVLYDNVQEYEKAIKYYKKFLILCQTINDANGEALAYNCLAVNHQLLGDEGNTKMYEQSIKYHLKHREIGDTAGKFTSCVNLGLIYSKLDDQQNATIYQQTALRLAVELSNAMSQSLAIGNLGKIGSFEMPATKARMQAFIEKYLQICKDLNNKVGEGNGYLKLGQLLSDQKKFDEGLDKYEKAYQIGLETDNYNTLEKAKFGYGITSGLSRIDDHLATFKKKLTNS